MRRLFAIEQSYASYASPSFERAMKAAFEINVCSSVLLCIQAFVNLAFCIEAAALTRSQSLSCF